MHTPFSNARPSFDPCSGGRVGLTTYANNPRFTNLRITDLAKGPAPTSFCDGVAACASDGYCGGPWAPIDPARNGCPPAGNGAAVFFALLGWLMLGVMCGLACCGRLPPTGTRRSGVPYPRGLVYVAGQVSPGTAAWLAAGGFGSGGGGGVTRAIPPVNSLATPSPLESNYRAPLVDACNSSDAPSTAFAPHASNPAYAVSASRPVVVSAPNYHSPLSAACNSSDSPSAIYTGSAPTAPLTAPLSSALPPSHPSSSPSPSSGALVQTASPIVHESSGVVVAAPAVAVEVEDNAAVPTYEYNVQF